MDIARKRRIRMVVALSCAVLLVGALAYTSFSAASTAVEPSQLGAQCEAQIVLAGWQVAVHTPNGSLRSMPGLLSPMRALLLGGIGLLCQVVALLPPVDNAVNTNAAIHYLQHGIIFGGGICMGIALRDLLVMSRQAGR